MTDENRLCCLASAFPPHHHSLDCTLHRARDPKKPCTEHTPSWFVGHWRDWHRGHGCAQDDDQPRSETAKTEIVQHAENADTDFLTDAELGFLRAATTSGDTLLVRALDELAARRRAR